jgi:hypothetical protein
MAKATLVLTDLDLEKGTYQHSLKVEATDNDDGGMSAAHVTARFIQFQLDHPQFVAQVWAYAEVLIADAENARIANPDQRPQGVAGRDASNDKAEAA